MVKMWRTFYILYYFYLMHLIFVSVWFYSWTKHVFCLCLPWLCMEKLLRMGSGSWGAECSGHGTSTGCNNLEEGAEWDMPRAGDLEDTERCTPGQPLCQEKFREQPHDSFGTGLVRDLNVWLWAQHAWFPPHPVSSETPQNCHPLSPGNGFPSTCTQHLPQEGFTLDSEVKAVGPI